MEPWLPFIGVIVAQAALVVLYFSRLRADDRRRWHERRLDVYAEVFAISRRARDAIQRVKLGEESALLEVDSALRDSQPIFGQVAFISSERVRLAVEGIQHVMELASVMGPSEGFPDAAALYAAERMFTEEVRRELGVASNGRASADPTTFHPLAADTWGDTSK